MSGSDICDGPSAARETPAWEPHSLMFARLMLAISIWSYARARNLAKVLANGMNPAAASPAAVEIMFCSAILHSKKRSGKAL